MSYYDPMISVSDMCCSSAPYSLSVELQDCLLPFRHILEVCKWEVLVGNWKVGQGEMKVSLFSGDNRNGGHINILASNNVLYMRLGSMRSSTQKYIA